MSEFEPRSTLIQVTNLGDTLTIDRDETTTERVFVFEAKERDGDMITTSSFKTINEALDELHRFLKAEYAESVYN